MNYFVPLHKDYENKRTAFYPHDADFGLGVKRLLGTGPCHEGAQQGMPVIHL